MHLLLSHSLSRRSIELFSREPAFARDRLPSAARWGESFDAAGARIPTATARPFRCIFLWREKERQRKRKNERVRVREGGRERKREREKEREREIE